MNKTNTLDGHENFDEDYEGIVENIKVFYCPACNSYISAHIAKHLILATIYNRENDDIGHEEEWKKTNDDVTFKEVIDSVTLCLSCYDTLMDKNKVKIHKDSDESNI